MKALRSLNNHGKVPWVIILILLAGIALGAAGGMMLRYVSVKTHTSLAQMVQPPFGGQKRFRILVLGEDNTFTKNKDVRGRSDTIMVAAVDLDKKDVSAVSVPRDLRCNIPGRLHPDKINAAFAIGGPDLSRRTLEELLGVQIDYYIKTNIDGLKNTVDLLGGVEIDIEKDMRYRDRRGGLNINLKKGYRHLDGDKVLQYVRFRHDKLGDITRVQRQQKFMRALARRMMAVENVGNLPDVIDQIMKNVDTNIPSGKDLLSLARLSRQVAPEQVKMETLPAVPQRINGISYMVPNTTDMAAMVDKLLKFSASNVLSKPTVAVLNGVGIPGIAAKVSKYLTDSGYQVVSTGNAPRFGYEMCEIRSNVGDTEQVRRLASILNCTKVTVETTNTPAKADVTVIVGKDSSL